MFYCPVSEINGNVEKEMGRGERREKKERKKWKVVTCWKRDPGAAYRGALGG